ncbi:MAG: YcaQ family DNA glycosylase [Sneathiella sp.]|nr:YcaQ family DNA glycosylase [Sneathiella sp.]
MNQPFRLSNAQARRLFMDRQGLSAPVTGKLTTNDLLNKIKALGFVQLDSINTVARAHHMILFSRHQSYKPELLTHLLEKDRCLFEHWTHDASVIPTDFYPFWRHRFARKQASLRERWRKSRKEGFEEILADILERITQKGPTMARDVGSGAKKGTGWWDWHPEKTALELHWHMGNLAIAGRAGFQKIYDLAEKVIPPVHLENQVDEDAFIHWACHAALERLGVATSGEIAAFWDLITPKEAASWCSSQLAQGQLIDVQVDLVTGDKPRKSFAFSDLPDQIENLPQPPDRIRVLSPFDPLIRDRKRCERLFGFDYRIEVFVPQMKRKYGYYVFPLLERENFIGWIDMKRIKDELVVSGLWLEPGVKMGKGRKAALEAELDRQRQFVGATSVKYLAKL